jgi:hypothetical protein
MIIGIESCAITHKSPTTRGESLIAVREAYINVGPGKECDTTLKDQLTLSFLMTSGRIAIAHYDAICMGV